MRSKLVSSITSEFAGRAFHALVTGALLVFLTRSLGAESYGLLALAISIFAFFRLFSEMGISRSAAKYVAEFKTDDPAKADAVVVESRKLAVIAAVAVSLILVVSADLLAAVLDEPELSSVIIVGSGIVLFYSLHQYNRILLQGYENVVMSAKLHGLEALFTGLFVIGFVLFEPSVVTAVLGYVFGYAAAAIIGFVMVARIRNDDATTSTDGSDMRTRILRYNVPLTVTRLSNVVDGQLDILLVGYFLNPLPVAFYTIGKEISRLVSVPAASIGFALSPTYGANKAAGQLETAASIYQESLSKALIFYIPASLGIILVADIAIPIVFGDEYTGAIVVVQILALFVFFEGLAYISSPAINYLGRARSEAIAKFVTSVGNLLLNILLIPIVGVAGAAVATVITHGVYSIATVYIVYVELAFDLAAVERCLIRVTAVTVLMGGGVYMLVQMFTGYVALLLGMSVGVAIWLFACHVFALLDYRELATMLRG
ncbi:oligosaccharide flippase family protein [Halomontanus rarus]|uniref:oligosaccharide flippase family protein n=1 Tax=Halomontanus rarus TaxID=3034020 RepID=UPI001A98AE33